MSDNKEAALLAQIIGTGKRLYESGLAVARSGNLSARVDGDNILITATGTYLGDLKPEDIVKVDLNTGKCAGAKNPSSELPLHSLVYKNSKARVVVHCHPPLINGYFSVNPNLEAVTFETKFYLGDVPVVPQQTPTVIEPGPVIEALKSNNIVVLKNHGTVAIGEAFADALSITEALEEAVKSAAIARIFANKSPDGLDNALKDDLCRSDETYPMFSREHIQAIVDLVNNDAFISTKGKELGLTVKLAIKLDGTDKVYRFDFENGHIANLAQNPDAPFVISAPKDVWEQVFLGKLDSFVAVTQGKMKLAGQLGQLSKWYVPFTRLFELFKQVKFK